MIIHIATLRAKLDELERHVSSVWSPVRQELPPPLSIPALPTREEVPAPNLSLFDRLARLIRGH